MRKRSISQRTKALLSASIAAALIGSAALAGCSSKQGVEQYLDPSKPVEVTLWTYYNGSSLDAFNSLVEEYNGSRGVEIGVTVAAESRGSVDDLASAVMESAAGNVGSSEMPDAFLCYSDTAFELDQEGKLADLNDYLTDEDKSKFVEEFINEGDIAGDGSLKIYPVSKSTETLQINKTDWDKFAEATGSTLDELSTIEGITEVAQRYYQWTDDQTAAKNDGKAFFGRDSMANYLLSASAQMGHPLVTVENGKAELTLDEDTLRALWDNYYVPMVNGWFSHDGRFRSDAVKTGDLLSYVGSSSSVAYFPTSVATDSGDTYDVEMVTVKNPSFETGTPCAVQQGAGFAVTESDNATEAACVDFLNWLTETQRNTEFAINSGYLPVTKDALTQENVEQVAESLGLSSSAYMESFPAMLETVNDGLYLNIPYENCGAVRSVMDSSLKEKTEADMEAIQKAVDKGASFSEASKPYLSDENFQSWYEDFQADLSRALAS